MINFQDTNKIRSTDKFGIAENNVYVKSKTSIDMDLKLETPTCGCTAKVPNEAGNKQELDIPVDKNYFCCAKSFFDGMNLELNNQRDAKPFACSYCDKAFTRRDHLSRHSISHKEETPFICSYCMKTFTRKDHLTRHLKIHKEEFPYTCTLCPKAFTRKDHLSRHLNTHMEKIPYPCSICNKIFSRKDHLASHLRTHTLNGFCCNICQKVFARKEHLLYHIVTHTK